MVPLRLPACGLVLTACAGYWALTGDQTRRIEAHLAVHALAFGAYAVAVSFAGALSDRGWRAALGLALLWRLSLVPAAPLVSDDVYRYVWEGRVQLHGGNPYVFDERPAAEKWSGLRDQVWRGVNWKEYAAIYPPLWQLAARAVVGVHDSVWAMKLFLVACEALTWLLLARALRRRGLPRERVLLAAWSPLALVEVAGSGHNEALGLLLLTAALLALDAGRPLLGALAAAAAFQAKLVPGLIAAAWARRFRPLDLLGGAALAALLVVPYAGAGPDLLVSLSAYAREWRFNETGFALLALLPGGRAVPGRVALVLLAALALLVAWRRVDAVRAGLVVVVAWLLLMPSVLPWYALWLLPFVVLAQDPRAPLERAAFAFTGTVALAYLVYPAWLAGATWQVSWDVRFAEYGSCALAAAWARRRAA